MKRQRLNRHMLFPMLTVIMLLSTSHICAQRNFSLFGKDVSVGVRAGITYSEISKSNYSDGKIGWLIAYSGGYPFSISGDIRSVPS